MDDILLYKHQLYSTPIKLSENIILYPITMENILEFQVFSESLTVRKNSIFPIKQIIKMPYLEFLYHCTKHPEYEVEYKVKDLTNYYFYAIQLFCLCCKFQDVQQVQIQDETGFFIINNELIDNEKFELIRKIIFTQNGVDFDEEFLNRKTELALKKAQEFENRKNGNDSTIEDFIDSLIIGLNATEGFIMNLSIRKFWRLFNRVIKRDDYITSKSAEMSGMVKFKVPIQHWTNSIGKVDKYEHLKTDKEELQNKIGGSA